jgi:hypothetical protein
MEQGKWKGQKGWPMQVCNSFLFSIQHARKFKFEARLAKNESPHIKETASLQPST